MKTKFNPADYGSPKIFIGDAVFINHSQKTGIVSNIGTHPETGKVNSYVVSCSSGSCFTNPDNLILVSKL